MRRAGIFLGPDQSEPWVASPRNTPLTGLSIHGTTPALPLSRVNCGSRCFAKTGCGVR